MDNSTRYAHIRLHLEGPHNRSAVWRIPTVPEGKSPEEVEEIGVVVALDDECLGRVRCDWYHEVNAPPTTRAGFLGGC